MKYSAVTFSWIAVTTLLSCSSARQVGIIEHIKHDTLYLSNIQYDSIYICNDHAMEYHPCSIVNHESLIEHLIDTLYIMDKSIEYRYRLVRDTICIHSVDTIPVIREAEVIKPHKHLPWYTQPLARLGVLLLIGVIICISLKLLK